MSASAAEIVFDRVSKRYEGRDGLAVNELSLEIPAGTFCVLVGPSGGGKTTALKMVNRLVPFDSGDIRIDGRSVRDLPLVELRRGIGYVIQQVGLFPHQTVGENIGTVPRLLGWPKPRIRGAHRRAARARRARGRRREAVPRTALGRPAPARRARARARGRSAGAPDGRAVRRARPDHAPPAAGPSCSGFIETSARRSSSLRTTSTRRSRWATGSRSSARAACSRSTTLPTRFSASRRRVRRTVHRRGSRAPATRAQDSRDAKLVPRTVRYGARVAPTITVRNAVSLMLESGEDAGRRGRGRQGRALRAPGRGRAVIGRPRRHPELRPGQRLRHRRPHVLLGLGESHWGDTLQPALIQHIELTVIAVVIGFAIAFPLVAARAPVRKLEHPIACVGAALHDPEPRPLPVPHPVQRADLDDGRDRARRPNARDPVPEHRRGAEQRA